MEHDFINTVIGSLVDPKRSLSVYEKTKKSEYIKRHTQGELINSTKFFVDDDLLEHAVASSFVPPRHLFDALDTSIPPVDNMWIEWNEKKRMELVERWAKRLGVPFENDSPIEHIGYHIHKVKHKNVYAYDQIFLDNNKVVFPICNYHLANDHMIEYGSPYTWKGSVAHVAVGDAHTSLTDMEPHCTHEQFLSHQHELGWVLLGGIYRQKYADDPLMKHNSFSHHLALGWANTFGFALDKIPWSKEMQGVVQQQVNSYAGDTRFLMALIALINYPNHVRHKPVDKGTPRIMWGRRMPTNEVTRISIDLPKPRGITIYPKIFRGSGSPKRRHLRRGHFRHYHLKGGVVIKKWIAPRMVGNAELGTIEHEYALNKK
jgi:hypothetical protein|tara:strand:- start:481 stop:1602 length:1122 start_codon:yes stop_codon:yes gene_type:complete